ncbi:hypothetical protein ATPR_2050 [Acetobacter tropicalis NBRC 101654]|uniref:Uncharacterized protein n=1 Tax=Acetobacter tropicalis NBRC 101654 TaxID=749388 RepID=F7VFA0_9PROT|nr:hypothetical protein ATPR_2050 [Acetobacter tropicalis NBRC 101654]
MQTTYPQAGRTTMATGSLPRPLSRDYLGRPVITGENRCFFFYQKIESAWRYGKPFYLKVEWFGGR